MSFEVFKSLVVSSLRELELGHVAIENPEAFWSGTAHEQVRNTDLQSEAKASPAPVASRDSQKVG